MMRFFAQINERNEKPLKLPADPNQHTYLSCTFCVCMCSAVDPRIRPEKAFGILINKYKKKQVSFPLSPLARACKPTSYCFSRFYYSFETAIIQIREQSKEISKLCICIPFPSCFIIQPRLMYIY